MDPQNGHDIPLVRLHGVAMAARRIGKRREFVRRLIDSGELEVCWVDGERLIPEWAILEWQKRNAAKHRETINNLIG